MKKTFKFKARISKLYEANLLDWLSLCRNLYNSALEQRIIVYKQNKKSLSYFMQANELPDLKTEIPEYKRIGSQVLQNVLKRLDLAFKAFFRRLKNGEKEIGFPRFRGSDRYDSFTFPSTAGWKLEGNHIRIKNIGILKFHKHREIEGTIKTLTIRKNNLNEWFVSFNCEIPDVETINNINSEIGIDVGLDNFLTDSNGEIVDNPRFFRTLEDKLAVEQAILSRKQEKSKRRNKQKLTVSRIHKKIQNKRSDFSHKLSKKYVDDFDLVCVEDLNIKRMEQNKHFSKSINDAAWGSFFNQLIYKAEYAGKKVVKVNPNGTSQECFNCGTIVKKDISIRVHNCPTCGISISRDLNAAINILYRGRADLSMIGISTSCRPFVFNRSS